MYGEKIHNRLEDTKNESDFNDKSEYLPITSNFDTDPGYIKELIKMDGLELIGWLKVDPVFEIKDGHRFVDGVYNWVSKNSRTMGTLGSAYLDGELAGIFLVEDWNQGCIADKHLQNGTEMRYVKDRQKEMFSDLKKLQSNGSWKESISELSGYGGTYGQTQYFAYRSDLL